jgi:hypothetical protein
VIQAGRVMMICKIIIRCMEGAPGKVRFSYAGNSGRKFTLEWMIICTPILISSHKKIQCDTFVCHQCWTVQFWFPPKPKRVHAYLSI